MLYKFSKIVIFLSLLILTLSACYMLLFHVGVVPSIASHERYDKINEVLLNLSYSYLAGMVFYIINDGIPTLIKRTRANRHVGQYLRNIQQQLNYVTNLYMYAETKGYPVQNKIYVEVTCRRLFSSMSSKKALTIQEESCKVLRYMQEDLSTIETMLVTCYISSETSLLLSEIRSFLSGSADILSKEKIQLAKSLSNKVDSVYWFPTTYSFRPLTNADASLIENSK